MNEQPNIELAVSNYGDVYKGFIEWISKSNKHPVERGDCRFMVKSLIALDIYHLVWYNKNASLSILVLKNELI